MTSTKLWRKLKRFSAVAAAKYRVLFVNALILANILVILFVIVTNENGLSENKSIEIETKNIGIFVVIEPNDTKHYTRALDSLRCYSQIHGYTFIVAYSNHYRQICRHKDKFFRRHCIVAHFLPMFDYLLFLDADIGVVNPMRRIEEFINPDVDVTFYDRFYNQEIVAGSYILKNSQYAMEFIQGFADYESKLPNSFHGTDNGALHAYVASKLFPEDEYRTCMAVYNKSTNYDDLFVYESCIHAVLGSSEDFPHIKILRKGTGWARDNWITNSLWSPDRDFMIHHWKQEYLLEYKDSDLPLKPTHLHAGDWYDPIKGNFDLSLCVAGNTTWQYDENLVTTADVIEKALEEYKAETVREHYKHLGRIHRML